MPSEASNTGVIQDSSTEDQLRLLVESVTEYAIFLLDTGGHIMSWNMGAQRLKGYTASEIIGCHFSIFYTPQDILSGHPQQELAAAADEGRYEEEGWRIRKDGTRFWASVVITALRDKNGCLCGYGKVTRDFTERKIAEETRIDTMRDQISRSFLRDILYSVTEGRLRFCEDESQLPPSLPCFVDETSFNRTELRIVRSSVRDAALAMGLTGDRVHDIVTASAEAAMNAVVHAKQATVKVCGLPNTMQVWIQDNGTGIELTQLHRATLERGYTTRSSLGHGFWLMLHTCDRVWLRSMSSGTTLVLEQDAIAPRPAWLDRPRRVLDLPLRDAALELTG